jgi:hypothetical protein
MSYNHNPLSFLGESSATFLAFGLDRLDVRNHAQPSSGASRLSAEGAESLFFFFCKCCNTHSRISITRREPSAKLSNDMVNQPETTRGRPVRSTV